MNIIMGTKNTNLLDQIISKCIYFSMTTVLGLEGVKINNLTEEILSITAGSDRGSYAKPLYLQALSSHSRV